MGKSDIKFTLTPEGAAALYLRAHAGHVGRLEVEQLAKLLTACWEMGILQTIDAAKEVYRVRHGSVHELNNCDCVLCRLDDMRLEIESRTH